MTVDELDRRLNRLAPHVDDDAALATLRHRSRLPVVVALAALVVIAASVVVLRRDDSTEQPVAADSSGATVRAPFIASITQNGIEVTVTIFDGQVVIGGRVSAHFVVRNVGTRVVYRDAGGCSQVLRAALLPPGEALEYSATTWNGVAPLTQLEPGPASLAPAEFVDPAEAGVRSFACPGVGRLGTIAPGGTEVWDASADARASTGSALREVLARFDGFWRDDGGIATPFQTELRATVPVVDDPVRESSATAALAAFSSDARLSRFVEQSSRSEWTVEFSWWSGAWELWVSEGSLSLRLRYDPAAASVADARLIFNMQPPGDDPNKAISPITPDTVLK